MRQFIGLALILSFIFQQQPQSLSGCCPVGRHGKFVVNADQVVLMIWDKATKTQHFIRQASFATDAPDVGFLVPSPGKPQLEEAGDVVFDLLSEITAPIFRDAPSGMSCGCDSSKTVKSAAKSPEVQIIETKRVAGFDAVVLTAETSDALTAWLKENDYDYSPAVAAWAAPYIEQKWYFTALKVAKDQTNQESKRVAAAALRISFETEQPLFPYREPESQVAAEQLAIKARTLRMFFLAETEYQGQLSGAYAWSGKLVWSNQLHDNQRRQLVKQLHMPDQLLAQNCWLSEYLDQWAYATAPSDLTFVANPSPSQLKRPDVYADNSKSGFDVTLLGWAVILFVPRWLRRKPR